MRIDEPYLPPYTRREMKRKLRSIRRDVGKRMRYAEVHYGHAASMESASINASKALQAWERLMFSITGSRWPGFYGIELKGQHK